MGCCREIPGPANRILLVITETTKDRGEPSGVMTIIPRSEEWKRKQSEGVRRAWAEGKYVGKPRPDYAAIAEKKRGRKRHPEEVRKTAESLKKWWSDPKNAETQKKKMLDGLKASGFKGKGRTKEEMDAIRGMRDLEKIREHGKSVMKANVEKWRLDGTMQKNADANRKRLTGCHGQGKNKRGSLEHSNAKLWVIRDPIGRIYKFINAREWVRENISLFEDYHPEARLPFWYRVSAGLKNIAHPRKRNAPTHYQGWTIVSQQEKGDLLGRDEAEIILP